MNCAAPQLEGGGLSYRETRNTIPEGTKPALLLHRAGGSSRDWTAQLEQLGSRRRVVALDLRGHGGSPGPARDGILEMAGDVALHLDSGGLGPVVVVGHSMGGAVALELTLCRPDLVTEVLLVGSGAKLRVAQPVMAAVRDRFELLPQLMGKMLFGPRTPQDIVAATLADMFDAPPEVVLGDLEACHRFDVEGRLGEIGVPVTIFNGKDDYLTPPRLGRRVVERVREGKLKVIDGAGHLLPQERPELVTEAILSATRVASANEVPCTTT